MLPRGPILVQSIYLSILYSDGNCVRTEPAGTVCARRPRQSSGGSARPRGDSTPTIIIDCPRPGPLQGRARRSGSARPGGNPACGVGRGRTAGDPRGTPDFHALRGTYIIHLVNSGTSVKTCQTLARHATPVLTIGVYAKTSLHDLADTEKIRDLTLWEHAREWAPMLATGTDGQHIRERFAKYLPNGDDGNGQDNSDTDGMTGSDLQSSMIISSRENEDSAGVVQGETGSFSERRRRDSNSGWRFCRPLPYHLATAPR